MVAAAAWYKAKCGLVIVWIVCFLTLVVSGESSRRLEDVVEAEEEPDDYPYDLSEYSVRFEKCQYVKMYDDDLAQDEDNDSPLALKHFIVYRLCPSSACSASSDCDESAHGVYTTDVETYLRLVIENQQRSIENMCQNCENNNCLNDDAVEEDGAEEGDDDNLQQADCSGCDKCEEYENLENNGYIDASQFAECQQLELDNDDDEAGDDDDENALYIGPRCNANGKIVIGLFSDENCWDPIENGMDVEDVLGAKLSYHLLLQTYTNSDDDEKGGDGSACLSCKEDDEDKNENDEQDVDDVNEMCEELYNYAAKCESDTGIENGFIQMYKDEGEYENQVENEFMACTFIKSLIWNSYTETGEINIDAPQDEVIRLVTQKQTIALSLLSVTIVSMIGAIFWFERKIKTIEPPQGMVMRGEHSMT